jgi:hypothetical protein
LPLLRLFFHLIQCLASVGKLADGLFKPHGDSFFALQIGPLYVFASPLQIWPRRYCRRVERFWQVGEPAGCVLVIISLSRRLPRHVGMAQAGVPGNSSLSYQDRLVEGATEEDGYVTMQGEHRDRVMQPNPGNVSGLGFVAGQFLDGILCLLYTI